MNVIERLHKRLETPDMNRWEPYVEQAAELELELARAALDSVHRARRVRRVEERAVALVARMERIIERERQHYVAAIQTCSCPLGMANNIYFDEEQFWHALQRVVAVIEQRPLDVADDSGELFALLLLTAYDAMNGRAFDGGSRRAGHPKNSAERSTPKR